MILSNRIWKGAESQIVCFVQIKLSKFGNDYVHKLNE